MSDQGVFENAGLGGIPGLTASADLSAKQHLFVKISGARTVDVAGAGDPAIGVLMNKPTSGQAATVWGTGSIARVISDGTVAAGELVSVGTGGKAVQNSSHSIGVGIALTTGASDGDLVSVQLNCGGFPT